jgi:7-keto-8-aminopelargonate synthetase-like enzyme
VDVVDRPPLLESPPGPRVVVDGREHLYFAGTSYLGLHAHPAVLAAAAEALHRYGMGAATSRAAFGHTPPLVDVEREAARLLGTDDALVLPSGWLGAAALLALLAPRHDLVLADESAHPSLLDAARSVGRPPVSFRHLDADALADALARSEAHRPLVLTDGVFALTGDVAPLPALRDVLVDHGRGGLLVDDAHGIGVLGRHGRGTVEAFALAGEGPDVDQEGVAIWSTATLSKAIGGYGGVIAGTHGLVERLRRDVPLVTATSPLPPVLAAGTAAALRIVRTEPGRRGRLHARARQLRAGLRGLGIPARPSDVPVVAFSHGSSDRMGRVQDALRRRGILIGRFTRYAGGPPEGALRVAVFADHTEADVEALLAALAEVLRAP